MRADAERVLIGLLHDIRTPLGVAHGYLRMVRDGRLPTEDARLQAIDKTRDALGRVTHLCDEASAAVAPGVTPEAQHVLVDDLVRTLRTHLRLRGTSLHGEVAPSGASVRTLVPVDQFADALVGLLAAAQADTPGASLSVEADAALFRLRLSPPDGVGDMLITLPLETSQA